MVASLHGYRECAGHCATLPKWWACRALDRNWWSTGRWRRKPRQVRRATRAPVVRARRRMSARPRWPGAVKLSGCVVELLRTQRRCQNGIGRAVLGTRTTTARGRDLGAQLSRRHGREDATSRLAGRQEGDGADAVAAAGPKRQWTRSHRRLPVLTSAVRWTALHAVAPQQRARVDALPSVCLPAAASWIASDMW